MANEATFDTLTAVHHAYPHLRPCLSTNGLLLEDSLPRIIRMGVRTLTVTVNAPDADVAERIYEWVRYKGPVHRGADAATVLVERQWAGIRAALAAGLAIKVNTVLIPGLNDSAVERIARRLGELGVALMNVMPLIPAGHMRDRRPPTCEELEQVRAACERFVPQFRRCEHCRADIVRFPAEEG